MSQEIDLEKYHQLALQKQKEHRKKFPASLNKNHQTSIRLPSKFMTRSLKRSTVQPAPIVVRRAGTRLWAKPILSAYCQVF